MKTWTDALGTCTAAGGSVGGGPVPDSGASPDIPRPPYDLASCRQDAPGASDPQLAAWRPRTLRLGAISPKRPVGNGRTWTPPTLPGFQFDPYQNFLG